MVNTKIIGIIEEKYQYSIIIIDDYLKDLQEIETKILKENRLLVNDIIQLNMRIDAEFTKKIVMEARSNYDLFDALMLDFQHINKLVKNKKSNFVNGLSAETLENLYNTGFLNAIFTYSIGNFGQHLLNNLIKVYSNSKNYPKIDLKEEYNKKSEELIASKEKIAASFVVEPKKEEKREATIVVETKKENIKNIAIIGHGDHDETTLADKLLQKSGLTKKSSRKPLSKCFTAKEVADFYGITVDRLGDVVEYLDAEKRRAFKYTYGICTMKMNLNQIFSIMNIDEKEYNQIMKNASEQLKIIIKLNRDGYEENNEEVINKEETIVAPFVIEPKKEESLTTSEINKIIDATEKVENKEESKKTTAFLKRPIPVGAPRSYVDAGYTVSKQVETGKTIVKPKINIPPVTKEKVEEVKRKLIDDRDINILDLTILNYKIKYIYKRELEEEISKVLNIDIDTIIKCYIKYIDLFEKDINSIVNLVIDKYPKYVGLLFESHLFDSLTVKEKMYFYLKYKMLNSDMLTDTKISEILNSEKETLDIAEITSRNEQLQGLNKIFNK